MKTNITLDTAGIGISALCIIHCLFLPFLGVSLPLFGAISEIEWVHKALVILALPVAVSLIVSTRRMAIQSLGALGVFLLCAAAFVPQLHDIELPLTVIGALALVLAHTLRLRSLRHAH